MATLVVTLPTSPPRAFEAWRDGEALLDPAWLRLAAVAIEAGVEVFIRPESNPRPAGWETIEQAIGLLRYLYGGRITVSSPDVDLSLLEPIPPGAYA